MIVIAIVGFLLARGGNGEPTGPELAGADATETAAPTEPGGASPSPTSSPTRTPSPTMNVVAPTATPTPTPTPQPAAPTPFTPTTVPPMPTLAPSPTPPPATEVATPAPPSQPEGFQVSGRAAVDAGAPPNGINVAIIAAEGDFRVDAFTDEGGFFTATVPEAGQYRVTIVGASCSGNTFPAGMCKGPASFFQIVGDLVVAVPQSTEVVFTYEASTIVLTGEAVGATRAYGQRTGDSAFASSSVDAGGAFALGLGPGTWTLWAQSFNPARSTTTQAVVLDPASAPPVINLDFPPQ